MPYAEYLTTEEFIEVFKIQSKTTIRRLIKKGMPVMKCGNIQRFNKAKCEKWFEQQARTA